MTLSSAAIRSLLNREATVPVIYLLTIEHDDLAQPMRLARNTVGDDIVSNGNTFTAAPFEIEWPSDDEGAPVARLQAINVDRLVGEALESIATPAECTLQIVFANAPNTVERQAVKFQLRNAQWDGGFMSAELSQAYFADEPWPKYRVTPNLFPALFR